MANVSTGILGDANLMNLREISASQVRPEVGGFFTLGEEIVQCFQTIRDQVVFTNKRVFVVNVQGITGKRCRTLPIHTRKCSIGELKQPVCWTLIANLFSCSMTGIDFSLILKRKLTSNGYAQIFPHLFCNCRAIYTFYAWTSIKSSSC